MVVAHWQSMESEVGPVDILLDVMSHAIDGLEFTLVTV